MSDFKRVSRHVLLDSPYKNILLSLLFDRVLFANKLHKNGFPLIGQFVRNNICFEEQFTAEALVFREGIDVMGLNSVNYLAIIRKGL